MKVILTAIAMLIAGPASAADMPTKGTTAATNAYAAAAPMFAGFYVGAHGGGAWVNADPFKIDANGFVWGGHAGLNVQKGVFVAGLEMAVTQYNGATKFNGSTQGCDCLVADLLAKVGVTLTPNLLAYVAGGGFWHNAGVPANILPTFGWTAGGGLDWLPFGDHVVLGARYLYRDLGNNTSFATVTGHELTGRISYKF